MTEGKSLSWRGRILMVFLTPIVAFGLLEVGLRTSGFRYEPGKALIEGRTHDELRQLDIYTPHPDLLWTLRPSSILDDEANGFPRVETNAHGLRGEELPRPNTKAPGELRVLCLGDSVTFGLGLSAGETWPDRMAEELRSAPALRGRKVLAVNAAVPGYSSVQGVRQLEQLRDLEFDVIVFYFGMNDAGPMRMLPDSALAPSAGGESSLLAECRKLRILQFVQKVVTSLRQSTVEGTRVSREEFRACVRSLIELGRAGGPRVIFVREPECCDLTIAQMERVVARAEEEGVDAIAGPHVLLSWVGPAPEGADLTGIRIIRMRVPTLRFRPELGTRGYGEVDGYSTVAELRADLESLRERKRNLDGMLEGLPDGSLDYEDLFGDAPPRQVFSDNCHLTREGARRAGQAIAGEVLRRLR